MVVMISYLRIRLPPSSTRTDTLLPATTLFRSPAGLATSPFFIHPDVWPARPAQQSPRHTTHLTSRPVLLNPSLNTRQLREVLMSYLTDKLRAPRREAEGDITVPGQMLDDIVAANPARRTLLKNSVGLSLLSVFGATLAGCGSGSDDDDDDDSGGNGGGTDPSGADYSVNFTPLADHLTPDAVLVPAGYVAQVLYSAGGKFMIGSVG